MTSLKLFFATLVLLATSLFPLTLSAQQPPSCDIYGGTTYQGCVEGSRLYYSYSGDNTRLFASPWGAAQYFASLYSTHSTCYSGLDMSTETLSLGYNDFSNIKDMGAGAMLYYPREFDGVRVPCNKINAVRVKVTCPISYAKIGDYLNGIFRYSCRPDQSKSTAKLFTNNINGEPDLQNSLDGNPEGCKKGCNPVSLASQTKFIVDTDFTNNSNYPLRWERHYNSKTGWMFNYGTYLKTPKNEAIATPKVWAFRLNGSMLEFQADKTQTPWVWTTTSNHILTKLTEQRNAQGVVETYTLTLPTGEKEVYSQAGLLLEKINFHGQKHTLSYDSKKRLIAITDQWGNVLSLSNYPNYIFQSSFTFPLPNPDPNQPQDYSETVTETSNQSLALEEYPQKVYYNNQLVVEYGTITVDYSGSKYRLISEVLKENGDIVEYGYGENGNASFLLTSITDGSGNVYGKYGYTYSSSSGAKLITVEHGTTGDLTTYGQNYVKDNNNQYIYFTASNVGKQAGQTAPCANCGGLQAKSITYDIYGNPISITDFDDKKETRTYLGPRGLIATRTVAPNTSEASTTTYVWHATLPLLLEMTKEISTPQGLTTQTTSLTYDTQNRVLSETVSVPNLPSRTTTFTYTTNGDVETITSPTGLVTKYTYDNQYRLLSVIEGYGTTLAQTTTFGQYNSAGFYLQFTTPAGQLVTLVRDGQQRVLSMTVSKNGQSLYQTFEYDLSGLLVRQKQFDNTWFFYEYDTGHRLTKVHRQNSNKETLSTMTMVYNTANKVTSTSVSRGTITDFTQSFGYDALRRQTSQTDALNNITSWTLSNQGRITKETSPTNRVYNNTYNQRGDLSQTTHPNTGVTKLFYNESGEVSQATDQKNNSTVYQYSGFGDVVSIQSPDSGLTTFEYAPSGLLAQKTDARNISEHYSYDALERLVQIQTNTTNIYSNQTPMLHNGNQTVSFDYDNCQNGIGELCSITDIQGATSFKYNDLQQLSETTRTDTTLNVSLTQLFTYDTSGRVQQTTLPSGKVVSYTYDELNNIQSINYNNTPVVENVSYNALGLVLSFDWGQAHLSGLGQSFVYDQTGSIDLITSHLQNWSFGKNNEGEITSIVNSANSNLNQTYQYNTMGEIIQTEVNLWNTPKNYTFDLVGNRLSMLDNTNSGTSHTIESSSNKLLSVQTLSNNNPTSTLELNYDNNGNIVGNNQGDTIKYNSLNRLSFWGASTQTTTMYYNGFNQRTKKIVTGSNPEVTLEFYDPNGRLIGVYSPNSNGGVDVKEELIYLDNYRVISTIRPDQSLGMSNPNIHPIITDHIGSPRYILSAKNPNPLWSWGEYEPFGFQAPNENLSGQIFEYNGRFAGQRFDSSTQASHNGFRIYSSKLGRYMQSDPLGLEAGFNTYAYVGNNPVWGVDPLGLEEVMVAFWAPKRFGDVGHMYIGSMDGKRTYSSQWPSGRIGGMNLTVGRRRAFIAEGGLPTSVFAIDITNMEAFLRKAQDGMDKQFWGIFSFRYEEQTSCTEAGISALRAGGFDAFYQSYSPLHKNEPLLFASPEEVRLELLLREKLGTSKIRKLQPNNYWGVP